MLGEFFERVGLKGEGSKASEFRQADLARQKNPLRLLRNLLRVFERPSEGFSKPSEAFSVTLGHFADKFVNQLSSTPLPIYVS
jgi:hypothetical protein